MSRVGCFPPAKLELPDRGPSAGLWPVSVGEGYWSVGSLRSEVATRNATLQKKLTLNATAAKADMEIEEAMATIMRDASG